MRRRSRSCSTQCSPREHVEPARSWVWTGPDGEVTQTRPGPKGQKYHVPTNTRRCRFAYRADADAAGPWIVTEGAKAADAAAAKLPECRVLAIASSAKAQRPDPDVYEFHGVTSEVILWPDADPPGHRIMNVVAADLQALGCDVRIIDPAALGLRGEGDDAHEWSGDGGLDAVLKATIAGKPNGRAGGDRGGDRGGDIAALSPGGESGDSAARIWRPWSEVEAADLVPPAVIPWVAWRGELTLLVAAEKDGKTTLLTQALYAAITGGCFLGEPTDLRGGRIAYMTEMSAGRTKRWIAERGVQDADVDFLQPCGYSDLSDYIRARRPALLVTDTLIAFGTTNRADENNANDMRVLANMLRATGTTAITSHHSMKHDPSKYRGSGDVAAAVDMMVTMTRVEDGKPTDRRLNYRGRWPVGEDDHVLLHFERSTRTYTTGVEQDDEGKILHVVGLHEGCTRYKALELAGIPKGGRGYAGINRLIADGKLVVGNEKELYTPAGFGSGGAS